MDDDFEGHDGLNDDDPALDYIIYDEMQKDEGRKPPYRGSGGCLSVVLCMLVSPVLIYYLIQMIV